MAGEERAAMAEQTAESSGGGGGGEGGEVEDRLVMYKMKLVQFLGRTTPIILQNDNGPCPLLAICNVLLLRNVIQLNPDASEVSQEHLLQLVAARLLDSNTDVKSQDEAYQKNQQQNISDALEVLKRLPTGIDVNVLFRKINDFEFTSECAIFDLLDIGLCHGWIVDPEDKDTARAIGSKSYNALVGELVALETQYPGDDPTLPEDDTVDFAAATTATLGVPSPSLSRGLSFDDPSVVVPSESVGRKGDLEEEEELMKALTLSRSKVSDSTPINKSQSLDVTWSSLSSDSEEGTTLETSDSLIHHSEISVCQTAENHGKSHPPDKLLPQESDTSSDPKRETASSGFIVENDPDSPKNDIANHIAQPVSKQFEDSQISCKAVTDILDEKQSSPSLSSVTNNSSINPTDENQTNLSWEEQAVSPAYLENNTIPENIYGPTGDKTNGNIADGYVQDALNTDLCSTCEGRDCVNFPRAVCSSLETSEPIYEGEECILDSKLVYESREPIYEGETVLAEQADRSVPHTTVHSVDGAAGERSSGTSSISSIDAQLIRDFLKTNASQLTIYGLFCLQEGLKERELCVFFRNNHFSTMFKFEKELYLLATDQGYINQPDLVWEKLNEVNGDTVFMTGNFKEFRMDNQSDPWDQRNAMSTTADYLATLKGSTASEGSNLNSDLQLAIALQEQEFGQQPVCPEPQNSQPPTTSTHPRLITGPQVSRTPPPPRQDQKTKDKCIVM